MSYLCTLYTALPISLQVFDVGDWVSHTVVAMVTNVVIPGLLCL